MPYALRVRSSHPKRLRYDDALVRGCPRRAHIFIEDGATADELGLALRVGMARLLLRFPELALRTQTLAEAVVRYLTSATKLRPRTQDEAAVEARTRRALARLVLTQLNGPPPFFYADTWEAVVGGAIDALSCADLHSRQRAIALDVLMSAPRLSVVCHPHSSRLQGALQYIHDKRLLERWERLARKLETPAID